MPYQESCGSITWEHCTLRKWLNNEFYNSLPDFIRNRIVEITNQNPDNAQYGTPGGNPTRDKVFLLSTEEAERHFLSNSKRITQYSGSDYCDKSNNPWRFYIGTNQSWLLRSPGHGPNVVACVTSDGNVRSDGAYTVDSIGGVRPALWLHL
jgi:hypothetical protein